MGLSAANVGKRKVRAEGGGKEEENQREKARLPLRRKARRRDQRLRQKRQKRQKGKNPCVSVLKTVLLQELDFDSDGLAFAFSALA